MQWQQKCKSYKICSPLKKKKKKKEKEIRGITEKVRPREWGIDVGINLYSTWSNAPTTSIKERYVTSSGAILKQRHVNKQKVDFSSVLQQNVSTKKHTIPEIDQRSNECKH